MKKLLTAGALIFLSNLILAQDLSFDYDNPYLNFQNVNSLSDVSMNSFTIVDLSKLDYQKEIQENGEVKFVVNIPFYVNNKIAETSDFALIMINALGWAILKENKEGIVKNFRYIIDEDQDKISVGIQQYNANLTEPINLPGKYYLKLIVREIPESTFGSGIFVGSIDKRDGYLYSVQQIMSNSE